MTNKTWVFSPQTGGRKIPDSIKARITQRIQDYAAEHYAGKYTRIDVRFQGKFCYIDAYTEPFVAEDFKAEAYRMTREEYVERLRNTPTHLCRMRYFGNENQWSLAFYTYSHEKYEPCIFDHGDWMGTPEQAFATSAVYLE